MCACFSPGRNKMGGEGVSHPQNHGPCPGVLGLAQQPLLWCSREDMGDGQGGLPVWVCLCGDPLYTISVSIARSMPHGAAAPLNRSWCTQ